mmetsp:Transcript_8880/g.21640  ORF Transcript_8880/g.21640 Transcript_8880/m.21640 type:complete len:241 (-) Transcript_8880:1379-2101(-)
MPGSSRNYIVVAVVVGVAVFVRALIAVTSTLLVATALARLRRAVLRILFLLEWSLLRVRVRVRVRRQILRSRTRVSVNQRPEKARLNGECFDQTDVARDHDPPRAPLRLPPAAEAAVRVAELRRQHGEDLRVHPDGVKPVVRRRVGRAAVGEEGGLPTVPVQVEVQNELLLQLEEDSLQLIHRLVQDRVGKPPLAVQVDAGEGTAVIAGDDAVRVQHGHDLEDEVAPEHLCFRRVAEDEV